VDVHFVGVIADSVWKEKTQPVVLEDRSFSPS